MPFSFSHEFRVESGLIAIGPLPSDDVLLIDKLEDIGLIYFDNFFELSGN